MSDRGIKAKIIAEYERTHASAEAVRKAVGHGSYDYVAYVLRVYRGEADPRNENALRDAHNNHLMSIAQGNNGRGFPAPGPA